MCGITGILSSKIPKDVKVENTKRMTDVLRHRGPDSSGLYADSNIALGHMRLSIIDLEHGQQPMTSADGALVIVYNGEIYNFPEIKDELSEKGHRFRTNSDTEVVLHAFEQWGREAFSRFNGMFAFALWEKNKKKLHLVRDRLGIKPLYIYKYKNDLVFASEIKAFSKLLDTQLRFSNEGIAQYLAFQTYHFQKSLIDGVEQIPPGSVFTYGSENIVDKYQYIKLSFSDERVLPFENYCKELSSVINASVNRHLIADVAIGTYLSGGFDSSIVSTLSSEISPGILTFNGKFNEGKKYDESVLAQAVADRIGSEHHTVVITHKDFVDEFDRLIYHLDEPQMGPGAFSQYIVAREISKSVKVVLTGHGGDEFYAGYPVFKVALLKKLKLRGLVSVLSGLNGSDAIRMAYFLIFPLFKPLLKSGLVSLFSPKEIQKLVVDEFLVEDVNSYLKKIVCKLKNPELDPFQQITSNYIKGYLPGLFLVEDKISMAHSLESRTPLCDNEMLSLSLQIPSEIKLYNGQLKALLKEFGRSRLPSVLYNQPKRGFPTPIHIWFRGPLKSWVEERLFDPNQEIFNKSELTNQWSHFLGTKSDGLYAYNLGCKIFSILSLLSAYKQYYY
jgi:asparagine synthase (glutamine-hydrolysing)